MAKQKSNIASLLNSSGISQTANNQIEELLLEIEQLKSDNHDKSLLEKQIGDLRKQIKDQKGEQHVSIDLITPNPKQPRQTFTKADIDELAQSLNRYGQLQPLILIPQNNGSYFIFDGERRWRAAKQILWTEINAVIIPAFSEKDLHRKALITTLCRQDLNALDRAEAILNEIKQETGISILDATRLIKSMIFRLDRKKITKKLTDNLGKSNYDFSELQLNDQETAVTKVLLDLSQNPSSFATLDLKAQSLPDDLKNAIRNQGLQVKHSFILNRISAKNLKSTDNDAKQIRKEATTYVLDNSLTTSETTAYVNSIFSDYENIEHKIIETKEKILFQSTAKILGILNETTISTDNLSKLEKELKLILKTISSSIEGSISLPKNN